MNIILLSGGSGKRLWPLSNDVRSKQFIKIFKTGEDEYQSMLQRVYGQIKTLSTKANITIATSKTQVSAITNQLNSDVNISIEPFRRDTFPAIALAALHLYDVQKVDLNEVVAVCPVDPYVEDAYYQTIEKIANLVKEKDINLALMGIEPTYPSEKYGYIIPSEKNEVSSVLEFKEKPNEETAKEYIKKGALWNGGIFVFKLKYLIDKAHELIDFDDYYDLYNKYESLKKISFDFAVVEHEKDITVMRFKGEWKDLGTWNTLTETMQDDIVGIGIKDETSQNTYILNELDIPVLCMGVSDVVISASVDGILVSNKEKSSFIKPYVDKIDRGVMYAEKSWGEFKVIDVREDSLTIKVIINAGYEMNYHSHDRRDEVWTITSGEGITIVDGMKEPVKAGDVITMAAGCKHKIIAKTKIELIEVQLGKEISVKDKEKHVYE